MPRSSLTFLLTVVFACGVPALLTAQPDPLPENFVTCGTAPAGPDSEEFLSRYGLRWKNLRSMGAEAVAKTTATYTLPVVVHIVHEDVAIGNLDFNPADSRVQEVMRTTNLRFRHRHPGAQPYANPLYGADTDIGFCLASVDPDGNYTTGIVRHDNPTLVNGQREEIASALAARYNWPTDEYLNVYLVESLDANLTFNGTYVEEQDIVMMRTGQFNSGLTAHEIGHYLGLKHTFQGAACTNDNCLTDGDGVCDTPVSDTPTFYIFDNCATEDECDTDGDDTDPRNPYRPAALGGLGDQPKMTENYMSYARDCWDAFTLGQGARMQTFIELNRTSQTAAFATRCGGAVPDRQMAFEPGVSVRQDICNPGEITLRQPVRNAGTTTVDSFTLRLLIDGQALDQVVYLSLAPGAVDTVTALLAHTLPPAVYRGTLGIQTVNDGRDAYAPDSESTVWVDLGPGQLLPYTLNPTSFAPPREVVQRSTTTTKWRIDSFDLRNFSDLDECQGFHFAYQASGAPDGQTELCFNVADLSPQVAYILEFDYGYVPRYDSIINFLRVTAKDCASEQRDTLWNKGGLELATNDPPAFVNFGSFDRSPLCAEIVRPSVPFTAGGSTELCFEADGPFDSRLILDNIRVVRAASLPVSYRTFTVRPISGGKVALLEWETSAEENNRGFYVQRRLSAAGQWENIGWTPADPSGRYSREDSAPVPGTNYYRLLQEDADGTQAASPVRYLTFADRISLDVWPNPATGTLSIGRLPAGEVATGELLTARGRVAMTGLRTGARVDLAGLPAGVYTLRVVRAGGMVLTRRVVVW